MLTGTCLFKRLVFWESQTADLLQSACYSRPNTLSVGTYDTLFPIDADAVEAGIEVGFSTLKFRLATLVNGCVSTRSVGRCDRPSQTDPLLITQLPSAICRG